MRCLCFFQAEDGIRDLVRSRGLGDVYKRQLLRHLVMPGCVEDSKAIMRFVAEEVSAHTYVNLCLLYTSDAADERSSVDLGGRRIIKKKNIDTVYSRCCILMSKYHKRRRQ